MGPVWHSLPPQTNMQTTHVHALTEMKDDPDWSNLPGGPASATTLESFQSLLPWPPTAPPPPTPKLAPPPPHPPSTAFNLRKKVTPQKILCALWDSKRKKKKVIGLGMYGLNVKLLFSSFSCCPRVHTKFQDPEELAPTVPSPMPFFPALHNLPELHPRSTPHRGPATTSLQSPNFSHTPYQLCGTPLF